MSKMLQPGDVLDGAYEIIEFISKGGFGAVYRARQLSIDRDVALKLLITDARPDQDGLVQRFRNEVKAVRNLRHPNTVQLYDFHEASDERLFFTMEYLQGRSLRDLLKRRQAISPRRTAHILTQVLKSLAEAHALGIIHRDIKPANIMLVEMYGERDFVKVLDFGIAKAMAGPEPDDPEEPLTRTGFLVGTVRYMPPERIAGDPAGPYSDIYSLGMVAASLLMGRALLGSSSRLEALRIQMSAKPLPIPGAITRTPLGKIVARALAKNPKQRYQTAEHMLRELSTIAPGALSDRPIAIEAAPPTQPDFAERSTSGVQTRALDSGLHDAQTVAEPSGERHVAPRAHVPPRPAHAAQAAPPTLRPATNPPQPQTHPLSRTDTSEVERDEVPESTSRQTTETAAHQGLPADDASRLVTWGKAGAALAALSTIGYAIISITGGEKLDAASTESLEPQVAMAVPAPKMLLKSVPTGAKVYEADLLLGQTPVSLEARDGRLLTLELDGYQMERVQLDEDLPDRYTVTLNALPQEDSPADAPDDREEQATGALAPAAAPADERQRTAPSPAPPKREPTSRPTRTPSGSPPTLRERAKSQADRPARRAEEPAESPSADIPVFGTPSAAPDDEPTQDIPVF